MPASLYFAGRSIQHHTISEPINSIGVRSPNFGQVLQFIQNFDILLINLIQIF